LGVFQEQFGAGHGPAALTASRPRGIASKSPKANKGQSVRMTSIHLSAREASGTNNAAGACLL
jgi:hypothetical protein